MASGRGVDYKLIQTDPDSINTADKLTQAIQIKQMEEVKQIT